MPHTDQQPDDKTYYNAVAQYYDHDADQFARRYEHNVALQRIRESFREETLQACPSPVSILEIGIGPGIDLQFFSLKFPSTPIYGIDISPKMCLEAKNLLTSHPNVTIEVGSVEDIDRVFPNQQFDLIYVFFGALNTVSDFKNAVDIISAKLQPHGHFVLSAINKWYLSAMIWYGLTGRIKLATQRLKEVWGGYSPYRHLDSRCLSSTEVINAVPLPLIKKRGYSIFYPAWYQQHLVRKFPRLTHFLWKIDSLASRTFLWSKGEYALYIFRKKP